MNKTTSYRKDRRMHVLIAAALAFLLAINPVLSAVQGYAQDGLDGGVELNLLADDLKVDKADPTTYKLSVANAEEVTGVKIGNIILDPMANEFTTSADGLALASDAVERFPVGEYDIRVTFADYEETEKISFVDSTPDPIVEDHSAKPIVENEGEEGEERAGTKTVVQGASTLSNPLTAGVLGDGFTPMGTSPATANDIALGVNVTPTTGLRTYYDPDLGLAPQNVNVALDVTIKAAGRDGSTIKIPLDYYPNISDHPNFRDSNGTLIGEPGYVAEPFFSFDVSSAPTGSIVDSYDVDTEPGFLHINLKDNLGTCTETLNLTFKFNDEYASKIPKDTKLWTVSPKLYADSADDNTLLHTITPIGVSGGASNEISATLTKKTPTDKDIYPGGPIDITVRINNYYYFYNDFDPNYENKIYVDLPTGSSNISSTFTSYFDIANDLGTGYTRYSRIVTSNKTDWTHWEHSGYKYSVFTSFGLRFTPPTGSGQFEVRIGFDIRKSNGEVMTDSNSCEYTKDTWPEWGINKTVFHGTGDTAARQSIVVMNDEGGIPSKNPIYASYSVYNDTAVLKNTGWGPITGTSMVLYQAETDAKKLAFSSMNFHVSRYAVQLDAEMASQYGLGWSKYRIDVVVNKVGGTGRTVSQRFEPSSTGEQQTCKVELPNLASGEYIDKVVVTPLGKVGDIDKEGEWPGANAMGISYAAGPWENNEWPNGDPIGESATVQMQWSYTYDKDSAGSGVNVREEARLCPSYYTTAVTTSAFAKLVSSDAENALPGGTVNYRIQGYNDALYTQMGWKDPRIAIQVPKVMELIGDTFTLTDSKTGNHFTVNATRLPSSDSDSYYNYYTFQVLNGYVAQPDMSTNAVFSIPISFKVGDLAENKTYSINQVWVSSQNAEAFTQVFREYNPDAGLDPEDFGFSGTKDEYYRCTSGHTPLKVLAATNASGGAEVSGAATSNTWVTTSPVPAAKGDEVGMRLTIKNDGNTLMKSIKLYDIMPGAWDGRTSEGAVSLKSVEGTEGITGAKVFYWIGAGDPPAYSAVSMNSYNPAADGANWSTVKPTGTDPIKAVYLDFGTKVLSAGESLTATLKFTVPNADNQVAHNDFKFSASINGSHKEFTTSQFTFTTELVQLVFDGNKLGTSSATEDPQDVPDAVTSILNNDQSDVILTIPDAPAGAPTLKGHEFVEWNTRVDGTGESYNPGDTVNMGPNANSITLYAKWRATSVVVAYDLHDVQSGAAGSTKADEFTPAGGSEHAVFNGLVGSTASNAAHVDAGIPTRPGYTFVGWYASAAAADIALPAGKWDFSSAKVVNFAAKDSVAPGEPAADTFTLYAGWAAKDINVIYKKNDGTTDTHDMTTVKFDGTIATAPTDPLRDGYDFAGTWKQNSKGIDWVFGAIGVGLGVTVMNGVEGASTDTPTLTLEAQWTPQDVAITYKTGYGANDVFADHSNTAADSGKYGGVIAETPNITPIREGYVFAGWYVEGSEGNWKFASAGATDPTSLTEANGVEIDAVNTPPTHTLTLLARWTKDNVSVAYLMNDGTASTFDGFTNPGAKAGEFDGTLEEPNAKPYRAGYEFLGWKQVAKDIDWAFGNSGTKLTLANGVVSDGGTPPSYTLELTAQWQLLDVDVAYKMGDGTDDTFTAFTNADAKKGAYGATVEAEPNAVPQRTGYTFLGWKQEAAGIDWVFGAAGIGTDLTLVNGVAEDKGTNPYTYTLELTAQWSANGHQVSFDLNGADSDPAAYGPLMVDFDAVIKAATGFPADPIREGYVFRGWKMTDGSWLASTTTMPDNDVLLTAQWVPGIIIATGDIKIVASSFIMSIDEARAHEGKNAAAKMQELISRGQAVAWWTDTLESVDINWISVKPFNPTTVADGIVAAVGSYNVTYIARDSGKSAEGTVIATVYDNKENASKIAGNNFRWNVDGGALSEDQVRIFGNVTVFDAWGNPTAEIAAMAAGDLDRLNAEIAALDYSQEKAVRVIFSNADGAKVSLAVTIFRGDAPMPVGTPSIAGTGFRWNVDNGLLTTAQVRAFGNVVVYDGWGNQTTEEAAMTAGQLTYLNTRINSLGYSQEETVYVTFMGSAGQTVIIPVTIFRGDAPATAIIVVPATTTPAIGGDDPEPPAAPATPAATSTMTPRTNTPAESNIGDGDVPLGALDTEGAWSLISLILVIAGVLMSVVHLVLGLRRRKGEEADAESELNPYAKEQNEAQGYAGYVPATEARANEEKAREAETKRGMTVPRIAAIIMGFVAVIVLLILEDYTLSATWFNQWTIIFIIAFAVEAALTLVHWIMNSKPNDEDPKEDQPETKTGVAPSAA